MSTERWPQSFLDEMREVGDPPVDSLMDELLRAATPAQVRQVNAWLQSDDETGFPEGLPTGIRDFVLAPVVYPGWVDMAAARRASDWFLTWAGFSLLGLTMRALPQFFLDANAAQVFARMNTFSPGSVYRLAVEIVHLIFHVMSPGGLDVSPRTSLGVLKMSKLRFHHAFVRDIVRVKGGLWDPAWGTPINQEDMALAVDALCLHTLDALARLEIAPSPTVQEDLLMVWRMIGWLLGLDERLLPTSVDDGRAFIRVSGERQYHSSEVGTTLARELLDTVVRLLPEELKTFPAAMMRYLMDPEFVEALHLPPAAAVEGPLDSPARVLEAWPDLLQLLSGRALERLVVGFRDAPDLHGTRAKFPLPTSMLLTPTQTLRTPAVG